MDIPDIFIYLTTEADRPVCYKRIKPYNIFKGTAKDELGRPVDEIELKGFNDPTTWEILEEDKAIDALDAGEFPGSLLLKVGFGLVDDAKEAEPDWAQALHDAKTACSYQARVHVYQGKSLPASDSNGLSDPFVCVNFMGKQKCTSIIQKSVFPCWYETIIFNDISIPEANNFEFASQVNFRVYDSDMGPLIPGS